jgi:hypothetical protein
VNEKINERGEKLCSFMLFGGILCFLLVGQIKFLKVIAMLPEIELEFSI